MNTKELTGKANRVAGALSGIGIALECLAILVGLVLIIAGLAATGTYGESAPSASLVFFGLAALLSTVWVYALFGFLEYVLRLQIAQVEMGGFPSLTLTTVGGGGSGGVDEAADFEQHVATAPIEAPAHRYCGAADKHEPHDYTGTIGAGTVIPYKCGGVGIHHRISQL